MTRRRSVLFSGMLGDVRHALGTFVRSPTFSLATGVTVGLAVGLAAVVLSAAYAILLRALPYPSPERLVTLGRGFPGERVPAGLSEGEYRELQQYGSSWFEGFAASVPSDVDLIAGETIEALSGEQTSASLMPVFGVVPILGRPFLPDDEEPGRGRVAILSERLWRRVFGASPDVIGRTVVLRIAGAPEAPESYEIIGVAPGWFKLRYGGVANAYEGKPARAVDVFRPLTAARRPLSSGSRRTVDFRVYARLREGVSVEAAGRAIRQFEARINERFPVEPAPAAMVVPLHDAFFGATRRPLQLMVVAAGIVLTIGSLNLVSLLVACLRGRQEEFHVRMCLGATRGRLIRQLLIENAALAALAGAVGCLAAAAIMAWLPRVVPPGLARSDDLHFGPQVAAVAVVLTVAAWAVFGTAPALAAAHTAAWRQAAGNRVGAGRGGRSRRLLVIAQVGTVAALLHVNSLMMGSLWRMSGLDLGFRTDNMLSVLVRVPHDVASVSGQRRLFEERLLARVRALPGVADAATASDLPFFSGGLQGVGVGGSRAALVAEAYGVGGNFFDVLRLRVIDGRVFTAEDRSRRVAIVNEALAGAFPDGRPVGQDVVVGDRFKVIGVVANHRELLRRADGQGTLRSFLRDGPESAVHGAVDPPAVYVPSDWTGWSPWMMYLVVRTLAEPSDVVRSVVRETRAVWAGVSIVEALTFEEWARLSRGEVDFYSALITAFTVVGLLVAATGIHGTVAASVARRRYEIGVRRSLGAPAASIVWLVIREAVSVIAAGVAVGAVLAAWATRIVMSWAFEVSPTEPVFVAAAVGVLMVVVAAAACGPALGALRVDPGAALRRE